LFVLKKFYVCLRSNQNKQSKLNQMEKRTEIKKGSIVSFENGNYRVTSVKGGKVNLGSIFGKYIYYKGIPIEDMFENEEQWYKKWSQSESYMCM